MSKKNWVFPNIPGRSGKSNHRVTVLFVMMSLLIVLALSGTQSLPTAGAVGGPVCFSVADGTSDAIDGSEVDSLVMIDLETGQGTFLGQTTANGDIEAAEYEESSGKLFAIDDDIFGELSLTTGEFTGSIDLGTCVYGDGTTQAINDADGLAKDLDLANGGANSAWYGTARWNDTDSSGNDLPDALFKLQIDGTSGEPIAPIDPDGFGTGISCVKIPFDSIAGTPDLVDDIGFNQANGKLYGVANKGASTPTRIIEINKSTGVPTDLGTAVTPGGVYLQDIEGFSIDEDGNWLLSTGKDGSATVTENTMLKLVSPINDSTVQDRPAVIAADIGSVGILLDGNSESKFDNLIEYWDWESLSCYNVSDETASIGDYIWLDSDSPVLGIQDVAKPPAPGIDVTLWASVDGAIGGGDDWEVGTLTTDVNGNYTFPVPPGNYFLKFDPAFTYTTQNAGAAPPVGDDSDPDPSTGQTVMTTLTADEDDVTWDAGILGAASVGDFVWLDSNPNGLQDSGEPGIPGVTVKIFTAAGAPAGETVTDENGMYGFTVPPGDYYIEFDPAISYTTQNNGGLPPVGNDSDASTAALTNGETATFTLAEGAHDPTWDAGIVAAVLGDFVWYDSTPNGQQDGGEPGVAGVKVEVWTVGIDDTIFTDDDEFVAETYTDENGAYEFLLPPGNYYVRFQDGLSYTIQTGDPATDSDADPATGFSGQVPLASGDVNDTIDAGVTAVATLGDTVWYDTNVNGIQDDGATGISGVAVNLYKPGDDGIPGTADDIPVGSTVTDGSGNYSFTVAPGDYFVEFVPSSGYSFSPRHQPSDDTMDSDADVSTGLTQVVTLAAGDNNPTLDAGLYDPTSGTVAVGNIVWNDTDNNNGIRDAGEPGVPGVKVYLYASSEAPGGTPTAITYTDADGRYLFPNVTPGDYFVAINNTEGPLTTLKYSPGGGNLTPAPGDHPAAFGDDGEPASTGSVWIITQNFTVAAGAGPTTDIEDPVNLNDNDSYMTIDFAVSELDPTAISLGQFTVQMPAVPVALLAAVFMLLATSAFVVLRIRVYNPSA